MTQPDVKLSLPLFGDAYWFIAVHPMDRGTPIVVSTLDARNVLRPNRGEKAEGIALSNAEQPGAVIAVGMYGPKLGIAHGLKKINRLCPCCGEPWEEPNYPGELMIAGCCDHAKATLRLIANQSSMMEDWSWLIGSPLKTEIPGRD